jgi:hypothetical protein
MLSKRFPGVPFPLSAIVLVHPPLTVAYTRPKRSFIDLQEVDE